MFHAAHNRIIITSSDRNPSVLASRLYFECSNELQQKTTTNHGLLNGRANPEEIYNSRLVDANRIRW